MAFEIGERVLSTWAGPGTVTGELTKDEDRVCFQMVHFDNDLVGTKSWPINKLEPYEDPKPKGKRKAKEAARSGDGTTTEEVSQDPAVLESSTGRQGIVD